MISIKSEYEISIMREASKILVKVFEEVEKLITPGTSTEEIDLKAESLILDCNATPAFKGYQGFPKSICTSINHEVIHGIPKKEVFIRDGDIISIDIGLKYKGYYADSAKTYPVGNVSEDKLKLLRVTEESLYKGIEAAKPGKRVSEISDAIEKHINYYGYGIVEEFTGHGIGRNLHEEPQVLNFKTTNQTPILKSGMTICIEPMVNIGSKEISILKDGWTVVTKDKKASAHYEHMVLINENGCEVLTMREEVMHGKKWCNWSRSESDRSSSEYKI